MSTSNLSELSDEKFDSTNNSPIIENEAIKIAADLGISFSDSPMSKEEQRKMQIFIGRNRDVFAADLSELGKTDIYLHTIITGDNPPQRPYRQSPEAKAETLRQIEEMLKQGLIEPSTSVWQSPVVLVRKKNGEWRCAIDYRRLSHVTSPISYPLPRLEDMIDTISEKGNNKWFSVLDMASGYWQIPLDPATKHKTVFVTSHGTFQWNALPFGLSNAPGSYQALMNSILHGLHWKIALVYVDDVLIFSRTFEEHLHHLNLVFQRLRKAKLTLKPSQCCLAQSKVMYLGHYISGKGVEVDPEKTSAVANYPNPKTVKQLRGFLGLCNYYRRFVKDYAQIAAPLNHLTKKDVAFILTPEHEDAFQKLKKGLISAPILALPNLSKPFHLTPDASKMALGYILSQKDDQNREYVIAYGGRATRGSDKNYGISELECLAVLEGIRTYRPYLMHRHFDVITDHSALTSLMKTKDPVGRLARWSMTLQNYDFTIHYRPGLKNRNADALSRRYYTESPQSITDDESDPLPAMFRIDSSVFSETKIQPVGVHLLQPTIQPQKAELLQVEFECHMPGIDTGVQVSSVTTSPTLVEAQSNCPDLKHIFHFLETGEVPEDAKQARQMVAQSDQYVLDCHSVLYHMYELRSKKVQGDTRMIKQLAVPTGFRQQIMEQHHDELLGGCHQEFDRTYALIRQKYFWPGMYRSIQQYVMSCDTCQKAKKHKPNLPPPLTPMPIASKFERWHIDILGGLTTSHLGHKYILLVVDSFTRWMEAIPLKTQEASEVATALYREVVSRYGAPQLLVSDRGQHFMSRLVKAFSEIFSIKRHFTSAYHPQTNSTCERYNSTIAQALHAYCAKSQEKWDFFLPGVLMALPRTPATRSTQHSPFFLLFGQEMVAPIDTELIP